MARTRRDARIETRTARLRLAIGDRVFTPVGEGLALCYRRTEKGYGTWQLRVWAKGRYRFQALGQADDFQDADGDSVLTFFQAQDRARKVATTLAKEKPAEPITVAKAAENYLAWYQEHRKAYRATELAVKAHILPALGPRLVGDLTASELRTWLQKLASQAPRRRTPAGKRQKFGAKAETDSAKRARRATANRIWTVLKAILNKAFRDELVTDDTPWRKVRPFERADEPIVRFLTEVESTRLINACRPDLRKLVKAALFTGARYSELANLKCSDFHPDTSMVYIQPGKSGRGRFVPLNAQGLSFFEELVAGRRPDSAILTKDGGGMWGKNHHVKALLAACNAAKISPAIGFHELRHTYASLLAQAGADLLTISKLLGHADTRITSRHYAHLCDSTLAKAVRAMLPGFGHESKSKVVALPVQAQNDRA